MRLTATAVKNAKPKNKLYRMADGQGLCLEVTPSGGKHWRFRYRIGGKASMVSHGSRRAGPSIRRSGHGAPGSGACSPGILLASSKK
ncbi:MAG: Arm DNA-binding domain-containing protein [Desulfovibrionaceae bacterium]